MTIAGQSDACAPPRNLPSPPWNNTDLEIGQAIVSFTRVATGFPYRLTAFPHNRGRSERKTCSLRIPSVWPRRRREVLVEPSDDYLRDSIAVLLHHHHVPIPAETNVRQFDEGDIHARLLEVAHGAMVIGGV